MSIIDEVRFCFSIYVTWALKYSQGSLGVETIQDFFCVSVDIITHYI